MDKQNVRSVNNIYIIAIVALVAIVGMVLIISTTRTSSTRVSKTSASAGLATGILTGQEVACGDFDLDGKISQEDIDLFADYLTTGTIEPKEPCTLDLYPGDNPDGKLTWDDYSLAKDYWYGYLKTITCCGEQAILCGNGKLDPDTEKCDDGNINSDDGCDENCIPENGWECDFESPTTCTQINQPSNVVIAAPTTTSSVCGNGKLESGESCDDGNLKTGDGCNSYCKNEIITVSKPVCGNAILEENEECDDGNTKEGDGCWMCREEPIPKGQSEPCGDVNKKDGVTVQDMYYLQDYLDGEQPPTSPFSNFDINGDRLVTQLDNSHFLKYFKGEVSLWCDLDTPPSLECGDCNRIEGVNGADVTCILNYISGANTVPFCSPWWICDVNKDGLVTSADASILSDTLKPNGPKRTCNIPYCGNKHTELGESCDDGNTNDGDGCTELCTLEPICGNGAVEAGEACDDRNRINGDGCSASCTLETGWICIGEPSNCVYPVCGNSIVDPGEGCDDGNQNNGDSCYNTCQLNPEYLAPSTCGDCNRDGTVNGNDITCLTNYLSGRGGAHHCEDLWTCDFNGDGTRLAPRVNNIDVLYAVNTGIGAINCNRQHPQPMVCGDCNGNNAFDAGDPTCTNNYLNGGAVYNVWSSMDVNFADGVVDSIDVNWMIHNTPTCQPADCGNAIVESNEVCDDGNDDNTDACLNNCQMPICGDNYIWQGHEECDDGNNFNTDSCINCLNARCGDEYLRAGVEECDEGSNNGQQGSGCTANCRIDYIIRDDNLCGDCNGDEVYTMNDTLCLLNYLNGNGAGCNPLWVCDMNGDGGNEGYINSLDFTYSNNYFNHDGPLPQCLNILPDNPVCGDVNGLDGVVNGADLTYLGLYLQGAPAKNYWWVADVNGDRLLNQADIQYLTAYLTNGGPAPNCGQVVQVQCGDCNSNGVVGLSDVTTIINYIETGTGLPENSAVCDVDNSGEVEIGDVVRLASHIQNPSINLECQLNQQKEDCGFEFPPGLCWW